MHTGRDTNTITYIRWNRALLVHLFVFIEKVLPFISMGRLFEKQKILKRMNSVESTALSSHGRPGQMWSVFPSIFPNWRIKNGRVCVFVRPLPHVLVTPVRLSVHYLFISICVPQKDKSVYYICLNGLLKSKSLALIIYSAGRRQRCATLIFRIPTASFYFHSNVPLPITLFIGHFSIHRTL